MDSCSLVVMWPPSSSRVSLRCHPPPHRRLPHFISKTSIHTASSYVRVCDDGPSFPPLLGNSVGVCPHDNTEPQKRCTCVYVCLGVCVSWQRNSSVFERSERTLADSPQLRAVHLWRPACSAQLVEKNKTWS